MTLPRNSLGVSKVVGRMIRLAYEARGLNQREAAELLGVAQTILSQHVVGTRPVRAPFALRLERVLGLEAEVLVHLQAMAELSAARMKEEQA